MTTRTTPAYPSVTIGATETITADQLTRGNVLVLPERLALITAITPYNLASTPTDRVILASTPTGRWQVLHILTDAGGYVRFPHEHVTRVVGR